MANKIDIGKIKVGDKVDVTSCRRVIKFSQSYCCGGGQRMMDFIEAFKKYDGLRLVNGSRWLVWDGKWVVYERTYGKRKTTLLRSDVGLDEALRILCDD